MGCKRINNAVTQKYPKLDLTTDAEYVANLVKSIQVVVNTQQCSVLHDIATFLQRAQLHCKRCISYGNSVRPSVCHTPVLCQNDGT